MKILTLKQLINLPVETKNKHPIGRIVDFEIDPDSQSIINYYVKPKQIIKGIFQGHLLINQSQVIDINELKMIVDDNVGLQKTPIPVSGLTN